ncbi:MAG: diguanylate cyclase [Deltaproteobacteria bacterium]|nr:diguanylate cyclase [Deltaproteobacteria bacterium]
MPTDAPTSADETARALVVDARAALARYQNQAAQVSIDKALALLPQVAEVELALLAHEAAAEVSFRLNDYPRALQHADRAMGLARDLGNRTREGTAHGWAGAALAQMSRYAEALERLHAAIDVLRELDQEPLASRALNYLAVVHEELGDVAQALTDYERAVAMARLAHDPDMEARGLANLGEAHVSLRQPEPAIKYLRAALAVALPRGDWSLSAWCQLALGRLEQDRGNEDEALVLLRRALDSAERCGVQRTEGEVLTSLGTLLSQRGERAEALRLLERGLKLGQGLGISREIYKTHLALSEAHERFGDYRSALQHYRAYHRVRADLFDEVARAQLSSLTQRHELEQARAQQEIDRLRTVELAEANARLEQQANELAELSRRDGLTGLLNRRHLDERLAEEFDRARRYGSDLTVAMADVDFFKQVNDTHSHAVGDEVLRRVSELFTMNLRRTDLVARYGGEEFALVFPETTLEAARGACEKLRRAVEEHPWGALAADLKLTISIGLASGTEYPTWERMMTAADARLYEAKRAGRNRVVG